MIIVGFEKISQRGIYGADGWGIFKTEKCSCCNNKKSNYIGRFEKEDAADEYMAWIVSSETKQEQ